MSGLSAPPTWQGPSNDPNDEQFGDRVERLTDPRLEADAFDAVDGRDPSARRTEFDAVLVGEPFDEGVLGRRGASQGPLALRSALASMKTHSIDESTGKVVPSIADAGDVTLAVVDEDDTVPFTVDRLQWQVEIVTKWLHRSGALPVFLGGDNSLTYPNAAPLLESGSLGCINFDAHLDVREVREDGGPTSGTPYRQLHDDGLDAYACVGARSFETSGTYVEYVRDRGGEIVTAEDVSESPETATERALSAMGDVDRVYVSVDLDVLDVTAAPGVSAPTPGGLSTRELFRMVRRVGADERVAGFEVVECAPPLDLDDRTAAAGARAIAHFLAGYKGVRNRD